LNKGRARSEVEESLEIGSLLPFAVSHNKVIKVSEDTGIKSFKFGPFRGIIELVFRSNFHRKTDEVFLVLDHPLGPV
jgi:hypothetical protein